jgi:hypothetical protein
MSLSSVVRTWIGALPPRLSRSHTEIAACRDQSKRWIPSSAQRRSDTYQERGTRAKRNLTAC